MGAFCPECGTVLPLPTVRAEKVQCYCCHFAHSLDVYGDMKIEYSILFNPIDTPQEVKDKSLKNVKEESDGPVVERRCPVCGNNKMSYATLQLRSADEGQTVFYTCTKCKFKETENS